jgi:hypothetical protein
LIISQIGAIKAKNQKKHFSTDRNNPTDEKKSFILMLSQRFYFAVFTFVASFDQHGRIIPQKHLEDRKMEDRKMIRKRIIFIMILHSGMFAVCSIPSSSTSLA